MINRALRERFVERIRGLHGSYRRVFQTPDGERVLRHIMKASNTLGSSFNPKNPYETAFKEGQRHLALSILKYVNRNTDELIKTIEDELAKRDESEL